MHNFIVKNTNKPKEKNKYLIKSYQTRNTTVLLKKFSNMLEKPSFHRIFLQLVGSELNPFIHSQSSHFRVLNLLKWGKLQCPMPNSLSP